MGASSEKKFNSSKKVVGNFGEGIPFSEIKNEPMFFNSDFNYAYEKGGPITRSFLDNLPDDWKNQPLAFDSRVHMLMPGWFPAIPGWHHDDVPRPEIPTGQHFTMSAIPEDELIYRNWHQEVERLIKEGTLTKELTNNGELVYFDWQSFHTGTKAVSNGWRWFGRVTRNSDRVNKTTNEIRVNCQVYLEFPMEGW